MLHLHLKPILKVHLYEYMHLTTQTTLCDDSYNLLLVLVVLNQQFESSNIPTKMKTKLCTLTHNNPTHVAQHD